MASDQGEVVLNSCTIRDNTADDGGGLLLLSGEVSIGNATLSHNTANTQGGGIANSDAELDVVFTTIFGNTAPMRAGGGIVNVGPQGHVTLRNTIVASDSGGTVIMLAGKFRSDGHNMFSDRPNVPLNTRTDLTETDPQLLPLADNGGRTQTHALTKESPARDAGAPVSDQSPPNPGSPDYPTGFHLDQRGIRRPQGPAPDIGAFEFERRVGDSNDDGLFDSLDFVHVFQIGKYETGLPADWSEGDWNGDGFFDSADFVLAFQEGRYEAGAASTLRPMAAAVDSLFAWADRQMGRRRSRPPTFTSPSVEMQIPIQDGS